jgi:hypothetical protein
MLSCRMQDIFLTPNMDEESSQTGHQTSHTPARLPLWGSADKQLIPDVFSTSTDDRRRE